jgi:type IV pilus assembly protein PilB
MATPTAPAGKPHVRIGDLLIQAGRITQVQLDEAVRLQQRTGERLGSALVRAGYITEAELSQALSGQLGVAAATAKDLEIDPEIVKLLTDEFVKRFEVVPVRRDGQALIIACATPNNLRLLDEVRFVTGVREVRAMLATEMAIRRVIEKHYSTHALLEEVIQNGGLYDKALKVAPVDGLTKAQEAAEGADGEGANDVYKLKAESETQPIVALVNYLLIEAVRRSASDIHVEPYEEFFRVRMRIDGMLHPVLNPPTRLHKAIISRLKILSGMDISKVRVPQDGHIAIEYTGEVLHYRVNTLPTIYGEKCVIRLMKKESHLADIDRLGFAANVLTRLNHTIALPQGLVLVTGPTGSGKTTTVHACLNKINRPETNVVTLEDPVEASIPGINHVQIHRRGGVSFVDGLRAILRQDPDVIFVGEIRDREVAQTAMEAAMTGHMVFSTLHTNSACESLTRLDDMGVEMFLIAGCLRAVAAQRLIRRICPQCKVPCDPDVMGLQELGLTTEQIVAGRYFRGKGCNHCMSSGFKGRVAAYEVLFVDEEVRQLIRRRAPVEQVQEAAQRNGMRTLLDAGTELVLQGLTTLEEVHRCIGAP